MANPKNKKTELQRNIRLTVKEDQFLKRFHLSPTKIFKEALRALMHGVYDLPANHSVYLSNSTNQPQGKTDPLNTSSAPGTPPGPGPGTTPAALVESVDLVESMDRPDLVDLVDLVDQETEPVREQDREISAPPASVHHVLIEPVRPAVTSDIEELCEPVPVHQVHQVRPAPLSIMQKMMVQSSRDFMDLPTVVDLTYSPP